MKASSWGWFSTRQFDLTFFMGPYLITWLVMLALPREILQRDDYLVYAPLVLWFLIEIAFVSGHIWSTVFRTLFDKETKANYSKQFLIGVPCVCFLTLLSLSLWSVEIAIRFLFYAAIYHGVKQFFGIAALYTARSVYLKGEVSETEKRWLVIQRKWDRRLLGGSFLLCFMYWHFTLPENITIPFNFASMDFIPWLLGEQLYSSMTLSSWMLMIQAIFYVSLLGLIGGWVYSYLRAPLSLPLAKMIWILLNVITYYWVFVWYSGTFLLVLCLNPIHAIGYYGINGLYQAHSGLSIRKFLFTSISFATVNIVLLKMFVEDDRAEFASFAANTFSGFEGLQGLALCLAIAIFFTIDVSHYIYDAHLWRFNQKNPKLHDRLIKQIRS
jgi:hypothetical protein